MNILKKTLILTFTMITAMTVLFIFLMNEKEDEKKLLGLIIAMLGVTLVFLGTAIYFFKTDLPGSMKSRAKIVKKLSETAGLSFEDARCEKIARMSMESDYWYMELKAMRRKYTDAVDYISADRNDPLRLYLVIFTDALLVLKSSREEQMEIIHRAFNWLFDLIDQKKCLDEKDVVQHFFEMKEVKLTSIDVFSCYRAYMETQGRYLRLANEEFRPGNGELDTLLNKYGNNKNDKDKDEKASDDSISGNAGQMEGVNACVKDE